MYQGKSEQPPSLLQWYPTQPTPQHCTTGKSWRECDQPHPIVLQPFNFMSQHCPTFHPDNTAIVNMGKYQSVMQSFLGLKWQKGRHPTESGQTAQAASSHLTHLVFPGEVSVYIHTKYLTFSSLTSIDPSSWIQIRSALHFLCLLRPSVEFYQLILFDPVGHCSKLCFKYFLYFLRIFA